MINIGGKTMEEINDKNYSKFIRNKNGKPMKAIKFGSTQCQPCKLLDNHMPNIMKKFPKIEWGKVTIDKSDCDRIVSNLKITAVPQIIIYEKGKMVLQIEGYDNEKSIIDAINEIYV